MYYNLLAKFLKPAATQNTEFVPASRGSHGGVHVQGRVDETGVRKPQGTYDKMAMDNQVYGAGRIFWTIKLGYINSCNQLWYLKPFDAKMIANKKI